MALYLIAAIATDGGIGQGGRLPGPRLQCDQRWFEWITTAQRPLRMAAHFVTRPEMQGAANPLLGFARGQNNACIAGWKTVASLPAGLPGRTVICLRDQTSHGAGDWSCKARTLHEAIEKAAALGAPHTFVIGGARVYREALEHPDLAALILTLVDASYPEADTHFPLVPTEWGAQGWQLVGKSRWVQDNGIVPRYRLGFWTREDS